MHAVEWASKLRSKYKDVRQFQQPLKIRLTFRIFAKWYFK